MIMLEALKILFPALLGVAQFRLANSNNVNLHDCIVAIGSSSQLLV